MNNDIFNCQCHCHYKQHNTQFCKSMQDRCEHCASLVDSSDREIDKKGLGFPNETIERFIEVIYRTGYDQGVHETGVLPDIFMKDWKEEFELILKDYVSQNQGKST